MESASLVVVALVDVEACMREHQRAKRVGVAARRGSTELRRGVLGDRESDGARAALDGILRAQVGSDVLVLGAQRVVERRAAAETETRDPYAAG